MISKRALRALCMVAVLLGGHYASVPGYAATAARGTQPASSGPCPYPPLERVATCFSPTDRARAESYMRPKPIDPSAIVDTAAGLSLHSVMIVWCSALPVRKPPPCPLAHTHNLMYAYGDGYLSSPQEASPPFFWITESRDLKARKPSIKMKQGGGPIVGCEGNVCHTGQDTVLWLVTIIVPKRRLEIDIMSNQPYAAVNAVSVGLLHAGGR